MKIKTWWITNGIWFIVLAILSKIIDSRQYDGSGEFQTPQLKLISLAVFLVLVVIVVLIQMFLYRMVKRNEKKG